MTLLYKLFLLILIPLSSWAAVPMKIYVRASFYDYVQAALQPCDDVEIKSLPSPMLSLVLRQGDNAEAHLYVGLDETQLAFSTQMRTLPFAQGDLALITRVPFTGTWSAWLQLGKLLICADPRTSSTAAAFFRWAQSQGYKEATIREWCQVMPSSLASAYALFTSGAGDGMIGYTTTPELSRGRGDSQPEYVFPLEGAKEIWSLGVTKTGEKHPQMDALLTHLLSPQGQEVLRQKAHLEPVGNSKHGL